MTLLMRDQENIEKGRQQGIEQGIAIGENQGTERINKLNQLLIQDNRYDDLKRSAQDIDFQRQLMSDYGI